eukprot:4352538-Amphidinium_carterae.1
MGYGILKEVVPVRYMNVPGKENGTYTWDFVTDRDGKPVDAPVNAVSPECRPTEICNWKAVHEQMHGMPNGMFVFGESSNNGSPVIIGFGARHMHDRFVTAYHVLHRLRNGAGSSKQYLTSRLAPDGRPIWYPLDKFFDVLHLEDYRLPHGVEHPPCDDGKRPNTVTTSLPTIITSYTPLYTEY